MGRRRKLLPGPVLIGFSELFDRSFGDPKTALPYPKVTPSKIGDVLLPFLCPHCGAVKSAVIDKKTRLGYFDKERQFSWCPGCRGRYVIDADGMPLEESLDPGATYAPALVERGDETTILRLDDNGLNTLGSY